ncbi:MAG TPA: 3-deoxy-manno-octulosonate cytidylyltransferase [Persephonella sp.]|uniref:3-deoxy-manno-octulosonate cytidylyltransferase n=1 Tax=Persephonella marina (strain DSM 14350 / EX-H1) TaxID=123214 RepID=C0QUK3_PERMH|nr:MULTISPECIES: 3-deoxy-manno-octulosonate cytidylyltransferase [Persephonella]ACO03863.1 3-deoxy-D-manno-octulosonate cytidylyltransferase [Persephonella marina EX-H1]HCB70015.1 3-deoxy-manno-octulosonate cytidylyltransferase [Persephonella sp.]
MAVIIIPARLGSTRLKNKLLLKAGGKPIIKWTAENCLRVKSAEKVIVATDSEQIMEVFKESKDIDVVLTPSDLKSGTDRVAFVARNLKTERVVNVQGDEPLIDPDDIDRLIRSLDRSDVSTLSFPLKDEGDYLNPNIVKVVTDKDNYALYFSRSPIPYCRDADFSQMARTYKNIILKHIGIYGYKWDVLMEFAYSMEESPIEQIEKLEQLRLLYNGYRIKVITAKKDTVGIDTEEDFKYFCKIVEEQENKG